MRKTIPDPPDRPKHHSHKDTKRWCKGKPGREHKPGWIHKGTWIRWQEWVKGCEVCGKQDWRGRCLGFVWKTVGCSCGPLGGRWHNLRCGGKSVEVPGCICGHHKINAA
jgi:hypothetical protein